MGLTSINSDFDFVDEMMMMMMMMMLWSLIFMLLFWNHPLYRWIPHDQDGTSILDSTF